MFWGISNHEFSEILFNIWGWGGSSRTSSACPHHKLKSTRKKQSRPSRPLTVMTVLCHPTISYIFGAHKLQQQPLWATPAPPTRGYGANLMLKISLYSHTDMILAIFFVGLRDLYKSVLHHPSALGCLFSLRLKQMNPTISKTELRVTRTMDRQSQLISMPRLANV